MWFDEFKTPIGLLRIAVDATGLRCVMFESNKYDAPDRSEWRPDKVVTREAREQMLQYFSGERRDFDLKMSIAGTEFQQRTWRTLVRRPSKPAASNTPALSPQRVCLTIE